MLITTGRVNGGSIEVEDGIFPEGAIVTILASENNEVFELDAEDEARLLATVAEANRGDFIDTSAVLEQIRKS
jgi:hypothetical protein